MRLDPSVTLLGHNDSLLSNLLLGLYAAVPTAALRRARTQRALTCACLMLCLGDKLPVLLRLLTLPWEGVERRLSFGGGLAGRTGTAPANIVFFLLEGGMRDGGRTEGTGSFSRARYTKCIACEDKRRHLGARPSARAGGGQLFSGSGMP